jgi:uncharacterized zinc-type alcohol dehydrogenase-like protein
MIPTKAFAAQSVGASLAPFSFERRDPGPNDVSIDIVNCGVCHTDIHFINNDFGMSLYPMVPGHEIVGKVTAVGAGVTKFKPGDLAGVGCLVDSCRRCDACTAGLEQYCQGGFVLTYSGLEKDGKTVTQGGYSTKIVVDESYTLKLPSGMPLESAAPLLCAGITTYSPLRHWKVGKGQKVAIIGLGGLGHMGVKFAASLGAEVTVLSTSPSKKSDSTRLGASDFLVTTDSAQVAQGTNRFDFILDTLSASHDYNMYLSMLKPSGTMVCVGLPPEPMHIPAPTLVFARKSIAGSLIGGLPETQEMLDYCGKHKIAADVEVIPIQQINEAFKRMLRNDVKYRFVIDTKSLR